VLSERQSATNGTVQRISTEKSGSDLADRRSRNGEFASAGKLQREQADAYGTTRRLAFRGILQEHPPAERG
jgi:hypothetical protein